MAQAFYPTNDGHVGNLEKKTTAELRDLLARQEKIIHNRKLLATLPDRGAKVLKCASQLREYIHQRDSQSRLKKTQATASKQPDPELKVKVVSKFKEVNLQRQKDNDTEMVAEKCSDIHTSKDVSTSLFNELKLDGRDVVALDNGINDRRDLLNHTRLGEENARLKDKKVGVQNESVTINNNATTTAVDDNRMDVESGLEALSLHDTEPHKHFYEVAEQRAVENKGVVKEQIMLNRALKISNVRDLPPEFNPPSIEGHVEGAMVNKKLSKPHSEIEDSAATPPVYKYKVKVVSLDESIALQEQQKSRQEELQAQLAAARLLQQLNIRMEPYNPEGTDMSYRMEKADNKLYAVDSDDDSADDAGNMLKDLMSDVDD